MIYPIRRGTIRNTNVGSFVILMVERSIPEVEKFKVEEDEASHCWCTYAGEEFFEVECKGRRYVVNLETNTWM
jgi:hypothetical protein